MTDPKDDTLPTTSAAQPAPQLQSADQSADQSAEQEWLTAAEVEALTGDESADEINLALEEAEGGYTGCAKFHNIP